MKKKIVKNKMTKKATSRRLPAVPVAADVIGLDRLYLDRMTKGTWITSTGERMQVSKMKPSHIVFTIRFLRRSIERIRLKAL